MTLTSSCKILGLMIILLCFQGYSAKSQHELLKSLLKDYDVNERPVKNFSEAIVIKFGFALNQIIHFDAVHQQLDIKIWMRLNWNDYNLRWNSSEFGGIDRLSIRPCELWVPDIIPYNSLQERSSDLQNLYPARVDSDGEVYWFVPEVLSVSCRVDVANYPWDQQNCPIKFGSWSFGESSLDIIHDSNIGDTNKYIQSSEWDLMNFTYKRNIVKYNCCPEPFPDVTTTIIIRRKSFTFFFNLILPAAFITLMTICVFYLPPDSGEKVALSITVLLALVVFLLLIAESVPPSESVPLLAKYFASAIFLSCVSTFMSVFTIHIHRKGHYRIKVPPWVRMIVLDKMARLFFVKKEVDLNLSHHSTHKIEAANNIEANSVKVDHLEMKVAPTAKTPLLTARRTLLRILNVLQQIQHDQEKRKQDEAYSTDWVMVALVLDRFLLYVFMLINLILFVGMVVIPSLSYTSETPLG